MKHTLSCLAYNKPGVLAKVARSFAEENINIYSLTAGEVEEEDLFSSDLFFEPVIAEGAKDLAAIFGELGRKEEAQAEVAETLRLSPHASMEGHRERIPFKDPAVLERYLAGLRRTGLPE